MDDPYMRELGTVEGVNGESIAIGVEHGAVALYFGGWLSADGVRLDLPQAEEFARLYVTACLEAERYPAAQDEDGCVSGARPSSGPGPDPARDRAAEGRGGLPSAASPISGMSDVEFERRLRELMRANPLVLETFLRQAERRRQAERGGDMEPPCVTSCAASSSRGPSPSPSRVSATPPRPGPATGRASRRR